MSVALSHDVAPMPVHIRWMVRRDMPDVLANEKSCFAWMAWTEGEFLSALRFRNVIGQVAERKERIVGHMLYELRLKSLRIINFAVAPEFQRRGIGRQMVDKLVGKLSSQRRTKLYLEVWERNLEGLAFFRAMGFRATALIGGRYPLAPGDDAIEMQYTLPRDSEVA